MKVSFSEIENIHKYPEDTIFVLDEPPPDIPVPDFLKKNNEDDKGSTQ